MWSRSWEYVPGIENPSPLRGEKETKATLFHGFRGGGLCRAAAPPVATARRPDGAFKADDAADDSRRTGRSHVFAGQLAGLLHPIGELSFVEAVVLVDVEVAHFLLLGLAGRDRAQRRAAEESHLDVLREAMEAEEPALGLESVEGRVPFDRLVDVGDGAHDERVEAAADVAFPARHGRDGGLYGGVAVALPDLRVAAREEADVRLAVSPLGRLGRLRALPPGRGIRCDFRRSPRCDLRRLFGRLAGHDVQLPRGSAVPMC